MVRGSTQLWTCLLISMLLPVLAGTALAGRIIYVDGDATGAKDGTSWATAFEYLQDALAVAEANDEIRVARGTYIPDRSRANPGGSGDREATFQLISSVGIYGGYAGYGETDPNDRDVEAHETILSGDLNGDDGADFANNGENSYHVITGDEIDPDTVLDGLTIAAGNANGSSSRDKTGGGIINSGSPTLTNCRIIGNYAAGSDAWDGGGGMYNSGSPVLTNCTFEGNAAGSGAGMNNHFGSPILIRCRFIANSSDRGGGMYFHHSRYAKLINCVFIDNSAGNHGGGFYNEWGEGATSLVNCKFIGNSAGSGGGMYNTVECDPELVNCVFSGNSADEGGAITVFRISNVTLTNCTLAANSADRGRALFCDSGDDSEIRIANCILWDGGEEIWNDGSDITITYSNVQGGWVDVGNIDTDPLFVDPDGPDDVVGTEDDDLRLLPGSPCVDAGDNSAVPADTTDVDGDADLHEATPLDCGMNPRFMDDPGVADTGNPGEPPGPIVDMGAYEGHNLVVSTWLVNIAEGQSATFTVALSCDPGGSVEVTVAHESGDLDVTVESGGTLTFNSSNYLQGQTVTLAAAEDVDNLNSVAYIQVSAAGFSIPNKVRVVERDNDRYPRSVVFVDAGAPGINNGLSWAGAYTYLQDALSLAAEFPGVEIRVAQGVYRPDQGIDVATGDRDATFRLINGVTINGGYAGYGAPDPDARNIELYETILSGDLSDNDGPGKWGNNGENSYHVVTGSDTDSTAVLDGFAISSGNANHYEEYDSRRDGGGIYIITGSPTLANCTLRDNRAIDYGGGIYNISNSNPTLTGCNFYENRSDCCAGGIYNEYSSSPTLNNCTFIGNSAAVGGAIGNYRNYDIPIVMADCAFIENSSASYGGVMTNYRSELILTNCIFGGNSAVDWEGGVMRDYESETMFVNCTFGDNSSGSYGGVLFCYSYSHTTLINCILWGNTAADNGSQIALNGSSTASIINTCLQGGQGADAIYLRDNSSVNWGQGNIDVDPMFADADNGDYHLKSQASRWDAVGETWVTDGETSLCIDAGDPNSDWKAELWPHGKRINMGAFGGTSQASMSESSLGNGADLDNSGFVNFGDFARLTEWWRAEGPLRAEDLNRDAIVNFFDILQFVEEWLWQDI